MASAHRVGSLGPLAAMTLAAFLLPLPAEAQPRTLEELLDVARLRPPAAAPVEAPAAG